MNLALRGGGAAGVASTLDAGWEFLTRLGDIGRERAGQWLDVHFARRGVDSTMDPQAVCMYRRQSDA